jgi:hypothetical protein
VWQELLGKGNSYLHSFRTVGCFCVQPEFPYRIQRISVQPWQDMAQPGSRGCKRCGTNVFSGSDTEWFTHVKLDVQVEFWSGDICQLACLMRISVYRSLFVPVRPRYRAAGLFTSLPDQGAARR